MLADAAEVTHRFLAAGEDYVGTDVRASDDHRQAALGALGFERFWIWDHVRRVRLPGPGKETPAPPGFRVRSSVMRDAARLALVRNRAFDDDWTAEQLRAE